MTLEESVRASRLDGLRCLRDVLAREIEQGPLSDRVVSSTAALARQLRDVMEDIELLEKASGGESLVDDFTRRREARRAGTEGPVEAAGGGQV